MEISEDEAEDTAPAPLDPPFPGLAHVPLGIPAFGAPRPPEPPPPPPTYPLQPLMSVSLPHLAGTDADYGVADYTGSYDYANSLELMSRLGAQWGGVPMSFQMQTHVLSRLRQLRQAKTPYEAEAAPAPVWPSAWDTTCYAPAYSGTGRHYSFAAAELGDECPPGTEPTPPPAPPAWGAAPRAPHAATVESVLAALIQEMKSTMQRDLNRKMVENVAFSTFDKWWERKEQKAKVRPRRRPGFLACGKCTSDAQLLGWHWSGRLQPGCWGSQMGNGSLDTGTWGWGVGGPDTWDLQRCPFSPPPALPDSGQAGSQGGGEGEGQAA